MLDVESDLERNILLGNSIDYYKNHPEDRPY